MHSVKRFTSLLKGFGLLLCLVLSTVNARAQAPLNYNLRWSDNFAGTAADTSKWYWRTGYSGQSAQIPSNITVDGMGNMQIANKTQTVGSATYTGGGLVSQALFRYGYYQVTAQTPVDSGWHTAFWLSSIGAPLVSWNLAPDAAFTEIDGFEIDSQTPSKISTGWYSWSNYGATQTAQSYCNPTYPAGFNTATTTHTYGIEWTETAIGYYIDGGKYCTQAYTPTSGPASPVNIWLTSIAYTSPVTTPAGAQATFAAPQYYVRDYYVNPLDTGYQEYGGSWAASSAAGYSQQPVRFTNTSGASAMYTPNLLAGGTYDVQVYQIYNSSTDAATTVTVNTASGPITLPAGTLPTTSPSRWIDLGSFSFNAGSAASITLHCGSGYLRSSMVKFVRQ